ncbi:hypothetical protein G4177_29380 [Corallococcus sp. ZKHCc1 1396]|uniref:Immunity protein 52 domain-containing protein n=1 Tax=Corallococcus soli TaxID=2710757 RepID=A0ABR9PWI7_9BACT|nr:immunity 52 family protein [Corallococcus soli]MBE4752285.1 hypothetical protein [Corallococcus soli]
MSETYYAGCYWLARPEPVEACAQRLVTFLRDLEPLDSIWNRWHQAAANFEKARKRQVKLDSATLEKLMRSKAHRFLDRSSFWLWAGENEDETSGVHGNCGGSSKHAGSVCILTLGNLGGIAERVLTAPLLTAVVRAMALAWEPEFGIVTSHEHRELVAPQTGADAGTFVGWVMYFADFRGPVPPLPASVQVEHLPGRGTLITLTQEKFTVSNPEHVALAADVQVRLQDAGLLRPLRPWGT